MRFKLIIGLILCILMAGCNKEYTCPDGTITTDPSTCGEYCREEKIYDQDCEFKDYSYSIEQTPTRYENETNSYVVDKITIKNNEDKEGGFRFMISFYEGKEKVGGDSAPSYITIPSNSEHTIEGMRWPTEKEKGKDIKLVMVDAQEINVCTPLRTYKTEIICE